MIVNEHSFTYQDMEKKLEDSERSLMFQIFKHMTEDNLLYLYQKPSKRKTRIIDMIAMEMRVSPKTVQNKISSILGKQEALRYFIHPTPSGIVGEYFVSPSLAIKSNLHYDGIYNTIVTKLEKEMRNG